MDIEPNTCLWKMHCRLFSKAIFFCNTAKVNEILVWLKCSSHDIRQNAQLDTFFQISRAYQNLYAVLLPYHTRRLKFAKGKKLHLIFNVEKLLYGGNKRDKKLNSTKSYYHDKLGRFLKILLEYS